MGQNVSDIIVERLIKKIQEDNKLPWQKPFTSSSINWYSEREYLGINRILLGGGEYITPKQLDDYNKKHETSYWFESGTPYELVVYNGPSYSTLTDQEKAEVEKTGKIHKKSGIVKQKGNDLVLEKWILRFYKVYNIQTIKDKNGNTLPSKLAQNFEETVTEPEEIIERYKRNSGVKVVEHEEDAAYYREDNDTVNIPQMRYFKNAEAYYRTMFHELTHSTGIEKRLNRECFKKYKKQEERSREELIAEVGSLLLSTEAGFKEDTELGVNSDAYILSWVKWMKNNTYEVVLGMSQAENAVKYILENKKSEELVTDKEI